MLINYEASNLNYKAHLFVSIHQSQLS
uniref:Uncharacterized protein n=1 Tax=Anguilla anguilla TaxID=7936 RepID=A0A0E9T754_ANGAN